MKKKIIYISRSLLTDVTLIRQLANQIRKISNNEVEVRYFYEGGNYNDKLVRDADLILVRPLNFNRYGFVGKGQYTEVLLAQKLNKPVFILTGEDILSENFFIPISHTVHNKNDWKRDYASFVTQVTGYIITDFLRNIPEVNSEEELLLTIEIK